MIGAMILIKGLKFFTNCHCREKSMLQTLWVLETFLFPMSNNNYLLTESEVMPGNIKLRLERIDRAIAWLIRQSSQVFSVHGVFQVLPSNQLLSIESTH